jgi:hypothetical protein
VASLLKVASWASSDKSAGSVIAAESSTAPAPNTNLLAFKIFRARRRPTFISR